MQANDEFMMHDVGVICMAFSRDGELLATGDVNGVIKVGPLLHRHKRTALLLFGRRGTEMVLCVVGVEGV